MMDADNLHQEKCDFCKAPAIYDGKTQLGPWAFMCEKCYKRYGTGLRTILYKAGGSDSEKNR